MNHLTQNETYFPALAVRMSVCRNTVVPISSSLCVFKRCKLLLFILVFFFKPRPTYFHKERNKIQDFLLFFYYILECGAPKQKNSFIWSTMKIDDVRTAQFWPPFVPRAHPPYARLIAHYPRGNIIQYRIVFFFCFTRCLIIYDGG